MYIHCFAHKLNFALVDGVKNVRLACDFFFLLEALYVFISTSKAHTVFVAKQKELHPEKQVHQLQKFSDMHWACRHGAVNAICCAYDSLLATLDKISEGTDKAKAVEATGLLLQIKTFKFLVSLIMFDRILSCTKSLSDCLQHAQVNLAKATDLIAATVSTFEHFPTGDKWHNLCYAERVAEVKNVGHLDRDSFLDTCRMAFTLHPLEQVKPFTQVSNIKSTSIFLFQMPS